MSEQERNDTTRAALDAAVSPAPAATYQPLTAADPESKGGGGAPPLPPPYGQTGGYGQPPPPDAYPSGGYAQHQPQPGMYAQQSAGYGPPGQAPSPYHQVSGGYGAPMPAGQPAMFQQDSAPYAQQSYPQSGYHVASHPPPVGAPGMGHGPPPVGAPGMGHGPPPVGAPGMGHGPPPVGAPGLPPGPPTGGYGAYYPSGPGVSGGTAVAQKAAGSSGVLLKCVTLVVHGVKLDRMDGLRMPGFGMSDPYVLVAKMLSENSEGAGETKNLLRTETIKHNLNPCWKEFTLRYDVEGDDGRNAERFKFTCFDEDKTSADDVIGTAYASLAELISKPTLTLLRAKGKGKQAPSGKLVVKSCVVELFEKR